MEHLPVQLYRLWKNKGDVVSGSKCKIEVPEECMADKEVKVKVFGDLARGDLVFVSSFMCDAKDNVYYSLSYYRVETNEVDLSYNEAISAHELISLLPTESGERSETSITLPFSEVLEWETFSGIEKMGFIWSMKPIPGCRFGLRYSHRDVTVPMKINIMVGTCMKTKDSVVFTCKNVSSTRRWYFNQATTLRNPVQTETGVVGTIFMPKEKGIYPAVIDMFGTAGGIIEFRAALLASHGFVCLSLPYFGYKNLPDTFWGLKMEYFENAVDWILSLPNVDSSAGVGVVGVSYGGELALTMGSLFPNRVKAVVAISSSDLTTNGDISFRGKSIPFALPDYTAANTIQYEDKRGEFAPSNKGDNIHSVIDGFPTTSQLVGNDVSQEVLDARIKVEKMKAALLLLSGDNDLNWDAPRFSQQIMNRLDDNRYPYLFQHICYKKTGHLIEPPYAPFCAMSFHKLLMGAIMWGGEGPYHNYAQEHSWQTIIDFLRFTLSSSRL